jgi:hypothetical protein
VTDGEKQFLFYRLAALAEVEAVARTDGDPAELLGQIRDTLGICAPKSTEADDATREFGRAEPAAA